MVCQGYMVNQHCVWCSMVDSVTWDNVQNELHGFENEKCVLGIASWGRSSPKVKDPAFEVRHESKNVGKARGVLRCELGNPWPTNA